MTTAKHNWLIFEYRLPHEINSAMPRASETASCKYFALVSQSRKCSAIKLKSLSNVFSVNFLRGGERKTSRKAKLGKNETIVFIFNDSCFIFWFILMGHCLSLHARSTLWPFCRRREMIVDVKYLNTLYLYFSFLLEHLPICVHKRNKSASLSSSYLRRFVDGNKNVEQEETETSMSHFQQFYDFFRAGTKATFKVRMSFNKTVYSSLKGSSLCLSILNIYTKAC